ncbi:MAG TPA: xanthine dehydrogenase family protein subunit M [Chloroflexota bacterium]|nr:xanthine dehydrogenase family protein subunit M [Chloroflexota bacterium]
MRRFELALPDTLEACQQALADGSDVKMVAGGTDLLPQMKNGLVKPRRVVDLSAVPELKVMEVGADGGLRVGAGVAARALELSGPVQTGFTALAEGAAVVGSFQIRNLATLGGNLANAAPSADMAPPLLALDAECVIAGPRGQRRVPAADFFLGVRRTVLEPDEVLVEIAIPAPGPGSGGTYVRHTPRRELDIAVVGVASQLTIRDGRCITARIALAAVAPVPLRATAAEARLVGEAVTPGLIDEAAHLAVAAASPISDQRGSAEFRQHLVRVLTRRTLATALARANGLSVTRNGVN